jgi:Spy/CpxP family protein refolding chaperone
MTRKCTALGLVLLLLGVAPAVAQDAPADNMQLVMEKMKADKKLLVAQNLGLTESEAAGFWPVYDAYQKDVTALNDRLGALIESYAAEYRASSLSDERAKALIEENLAIDEAEVQMRRAYLAKLGEVLPAKKAVRYLQIESKLRAILRYELAAGIPLVK